MQCAALPARRFCSSQDPCSKKTKNDMNLANKTYKDNKTGQIVKVLDSFENIAILENKEKIDTRRLLDTNYYTEQIDPSTFFNTQNAYNSLFEKIKTIPTENIPDEAGAITPVVKVDRTYRPESDEAAVIYSTIDDEKEELARKYGVNLNSGDSVIKQNEAFSKIIGDLADDLPEPAPMRMPAAKEQIQKIEVSRDLTDDVRNEPSVREAVFVKAEDPIIAMFRGVKRPVDFNIGLTLENKIPRLDFIEMMEDSYEKSIIEFLAEEFTNELLRNPEVLKQKISSKIKEMVYEKKKAPAKRAPRKSVATPPKKLVNQQAAKLEDIKPVSRRKNTKKEIEQ